MRLLAAFASAAIAWWLLGGVVRVDVEWANWLLSFWPISLIFTVVAVGGCTHALNIIDGINGLAGMVAVLMAASLAAVRSEERRVGEGGRGGRGTGSRQ